MATSIITPNHCTKKRVPCSQGSIEESALNAQIIECLTSLQIPDEFHTWAMKWLEHENAKEREIREDVRATRQKALRSNLKKTA